MVFDKPRPRLGLLFFLWACMSVPLPVHATVAPADEMILKLAWSGSAEFLNDTGVPVVTLPFEADTRVVLNGAVPGVRATFPGGEVFAFDTAFYSLRNTVISLDGEELEPVPPPLFTTDPAGGDNTLILDFRAAGDVYEFRLFGHAEAGNAGIIRVPDDLFGGDGSSSFGYRVTATTLELGEAVNVDQPPDEDVRNGVVLPFNTAPFDDSEPVWPNGEYELGAILELSDGTTTPIPGGNVDLLRPDSSAAFSGTPSSGAAASISPPPSLVLRGEVQHIAIVPVPAALPLLATALLGLGAFRHMSGRLRAGGRGDERLRQRPPGPDVPLPPPSVTPPRAGVTADPSALRTQTCRSRPTPPVSSG